MRIAMPRFSVPPSLRSPARAVGVRVRAGYPPYIANARRNNYRVTLAVAGFGESLVGRGERPCADHYRQREEVRKYRRLLHPGRRPAPSSAISSGRSMLESRRPAREWPGQFDL